MGIYSTHIVFHWSDGTRSSHEWCGVDPDTGEVCWEPPLPEKEVVDSQCEWEAEG
jgi:hypothetical protein